MKKRDYILIIIGIIFLLYYLSCVIFLGFNVRQIWIWLLFSVTMFIVVYLDNYTKLHLPRFIKKANQLIILMIIVGFISIEGIVISHMNDSAPNNLDYIIVLGSKVNGTTAGKALSNRVDKAYQYLIDNKNTIAILSGGKGNDEDISEAKCMYNILIERGINDDRLIVEDKSTSTNQNLTYSKEYIKGKNASIGVVTSNFHVSRAIVLAHKKGLNNVYGVAAKYDIFWLPHYMIREYLGICVDFIRG